MQKTVSFGDQFTFAKFQHFGSFNGSKNREIYEALDFVASPLEN